MLTSVDGQQQGQEVHKEVEHQHAKGILPTRMCIVCGSRAGSRDMPKGGRTNGGCRQCVVNLCGEIRDGHLTCFQRFHQPGPVTKVDVPTPQRRSTSRGSRAGDSSTGPRAGLRGTQGAVSGSQAHSARLAQLARAASLRSAVPLPTATAGSVSTPTPRGAGHSLGPRRLQLVTPAPSLATPPGAGGGHKSAEEVGMDDVDPDGTSGVNTGDAVGLLAQHDHQGNAPAAGVSATDLPSPGPAAKRARGRKRRQRPRTTQYHEHQVHLNCGLHAINNAAGWEAVTEEDLLVVARVRVADVATARIVHAAANADRGVDPSALPSEHKTVERGVQGELAKVRRYGVDTIDMPQLVQRAAPLMEPENVVVVSRGSDQHGSPGNSSAMASWDSSAIRSPDAFVRLLCERHGMSPAGYDRLVLQVARSGRPGHYVSLRRQDSAAGGWLFADSLERSPHALSGRAFVRLINTAQWAMAWPGAAGGYQGLATAEHDDPEVHGSMRQAWYRDPRLHEVAVFRVARLCVTQHVLCRGSLRQWLDLTKASAEVLPIPSTRAGHLTRGDVERLLPGQWISDEVRVPLTARQHSTLTTHVPALGRHTPPPRW